MGVNNNKLPYLAIRGERKRYDNNVPVVHGLGVWHRVLKKGEKTWLLFTKSSGIAILEREIVPLSGLTWRWLHGTGTMKSIWENKKT